MGSFWQPHPTKDQPAPPGGIGIDPRLGAPALRAPEASREDSCPQAILKFHHPGSLDYRARHGLPIQKIQSYWISFEIYMLNGVSKLFLTMYFTVVICFVQNVL